MIKLAVLLALTGCTTYVTNTTIEAQGGTGGEVAEAGAPVSAAGVANGGGGAVGVLSSGGAGQGGGGASAGSSSVIAGAAGAPQGGQIAGGTGGVTSSAGGAGAASGGQGGSITTGGGGTSGSNGGHGGAAAGASGSAGAPQVCECSAADGDCCDGCHLRPRGFHPPTDTLCNQGTFLETLSAEFCDGVGPQGVPNLNVAITYTGCATLLNAPAVCVDPGGVNAAFCQKL